MAYGPHEMFKAHQPRRPSTACRLRGFRRAGFTFVEILITLLILGIAVVPLMQLYATAVEQVGQIDTMRVALDLAREEVERVKNVAMTEEQLKRIGTVTHPPLRLDRALWYVVRVVDETASPLGVQVFVYRDALSGTPVVGLTTIVNK